MTTSNSSSFKDIIVLGTGAIGSYYGAKLSHKANVLLVGRKKHVDAVTERGLVVSGSLKGRFKLRATTEVSRIPNNALILLTTKAHDTQKSILKIRHLLRPETTILILQNGLGNKDIVKELVDPNIMVVRGLASTGVEFLQPGKIMVKLVGETILPNTPAGKIIKKLFNSCDLETKLTNEIKVEIWKKLVLNCVINPLTALFRVQNSLIVNEALEGVQRRIVEECMEVAKAEGVLLDTGLVDEVFKAASTYSNISSMCQDVVRGRETEIDFLNGKVVELAHRHRIDTPVNEVLVALIKFMEGKEWKLAD